jgi:hypothetical protein
MRRAVDAGVGLLLFLFLAAAGPAQASPAGGCGPLDHAHARWERLLHEYVRAGEVDYRRWKEEGLEALRAYQRELEAVCAADFQKLQDDQRLAFWINAYNAYTVALVLEHYPLRTIRSIGLLPGAAFRRRFIPLQHLGGGERELSLNDLEHGIVRERFAEPRIHFALVCASRSCPKLQREAWVAGKLDGQLDTAAREYLGDAAQNRYDPATHTLHLSSIFEWYGEDFERDGSTLVEHVAKWLPAPAREAVLQSRPRVSFLKYDWSLNEGKAR